MEDDYPGMDTVSENTMPQEIEKGAFKGLASVWLLDGAIDTIKREVTQNGAVVGLYYSYGLYYNDGVNDKQDSSYYIRERNTLLQRSERKRLPATGMSGRSSLERISEASGKKLFRDAKVLKQSS